VRMHAILSFVLAGMVALAQAPATATCEFRATNGRWEGPCGPFLGEQFTFSVAPSASISTGTWRKDVRPVAVWAGRSSNATLGIAPVELEVYSGGEGVLRTEYGWFAVTQFQRADASVRFRVENSRGIASSDLDREIVQRATSILATESNWNRADDRTCPANAKTWSIYCVMQRATVEVTGAFHHRRPALEVVREIIERRTADRQYPHRLMDYNNDVSTRIEDVRALFAQALAQMKR
jgi:hypothetical protein